MHLDVLRRHAHSGPIMESKTEEYREEDTLEYREANDCIEIAKKAAASEGHLPEDILYWIEDEQSKTMTIVKQIKKTIEVRSFD